MIKVSSHVVIWSSKYGINCTCACVFCNFYLSVLWSLLVTQLATISQIQQWNTKVWNYFKVSNEDTRGTPMFLKISMSLRLFWQIQLYLNFFQHYLSIVYFIWYMVNWTCIPSNVTSSTKLWGTQCYPKFAFRSTDFRVPENLIFPAMDAPPPSHPPIEKWSSLPDNDS